MAIKDGKKITLTDVAEEAQKSKHFESIKEASQEVFSDIPNVLQESLRQGKEAYPGDFFIEILLKIEKFAKNTIHPFFSIRRSCPNPKYKQAVFMYTKDDDTLKNLWLIPDRYNATMYKLDPLRFNSENVKFVLDFNDGTLQKLSDNLNKKI